MALPTKPCRYCKSPDHWPYQCFKRPVKPKPIKLGPKGETWLKFRKNYLKNHPPNFQGYYTCYLCHQWVKKSNITLDHKIPRSRRPDLVFDESNIRFCCYGCNMQKGSKVLDNL